MLSKLAWRNMKRSARDYLVYVLTMTVITAFMYAFNSLIFQNELSRYFDQIDDLLAVMIGLATFFIVLIVAWLIHYMTNFMLVQRSSEFGLYLLLGMKKKMIFRLYRLENQLLGAFAFLMGVAVGVLLQQVLLAVMFAMVRMEYHLHITLNQWTILMTLLCYMGCYGLALFRCRRKFKKMNIYDLMNAKRRNEKIKEKHERIKQVLFPLSLLLILAFWTIFKGLSNMLQVVLFLVGLVLTIYLFYIGLSAWIICYVRDKKNGIYHGQNLFLLRQFAGKVRTMQFTMGTLTALFTIALLGASIAMMFSDYENLMLEDKFPFDIQLYSPNTEDDFAEEIKIIKDHTIPLDIYPYHIYTDESNQANAWMLSHLPAFGTMYQKKDGSADMEKIENFLHSEERWAYCMYDTYMGLSDYNHLRNMLGYRQVSLASGEYLVHMKSRLRKVAANIGDDLEIADASGKAYLTCAGIYDEPFSQDGHNGGDYILVVPDEVLGRMEPYYCELAVDIEGTAPAGLKAKLNACGFDFNEEFDDTKFKGNDGSGSDNILSFTGNKQVRDNTIPESKYMLASVIIPLLYIGLIFLCVAVTVLSVQQLSDSAKYKFRYDVLAKLGLGNAQIRGLIIKQLVAYYLCPAVFAMVISGKMILFMSRLFVLSTGIPLPPGAFFGKSVALFFGIYLLYFTVTYIGFKRNVEAKNAGKS